jgi:hypothetical protein
LHAHPEVCHSSCYESTTSSDNEAYNNNNNNNNNDNDNNDNNNNKHLFQVPVKIEPITNEEFFRLEQEQERRHLLNLTPLNLNDDDGIRQWLDSHDVYDTSPSTPRDLNEVPYEIMAKILEWLPTVKDIQNAVVASRRLKNCINVNMLVRTAMMQGGQKG